jgi:hypothetical protein
MKKLPKKLKLAKETLLNLEAESLLKNVLGGETRSICTACPNTACAFC